MHFQDVFKYTGDVGTYQLLLYFVVGVTTFINGFHNIASNFYAAPTEHWCLVPRLANFSHETQKLVAIPYEEDDPAEYDSCYMYDLDYESFDDEEILNWNRNSTANASKVACSAWVFDQSVFVSTIQSKYNLVCGRNWMADLTSTIFMAGIFVGSVVSGFISDRYGRKWPMIVSAFGYMLFGLLQALSPNYITFCIMRFFTAFFNKTAALCAFVLVCEVLGPRHYTLMTTMYQCLWSLGLMILPGIAYAVRDMDKLFMATSIPLICLTPCIWMLDESPRWLVTNKKQDEACKTLGKVTDVNRSPERFPDSVQWEGIKTEKVEAKAKDLFSSSILCKRLVLVWLNWFTVSLVYYGVSFNAGAYGDVFLNTFLSGVVELPANLLCWICLEKGGRRWSNGAGLLATSVFMLACVPIIIFNPEMTGALTVLSTLGKGAITFAFTSIFLYCVEMFPTPVRHIALGTANMMARVGSMLSPFMGKSLESIWRPMPSVIFGGIAAVTGVLVFLLPETKGHPVPDTIVEAENLARSRQKRRLSEQKSGDDVTTVDVENKMSEKGLDTLGLELNEMNHEKDWTKGLSTRL